MALRESEINRSVNSECLWKALLHLSLQNPSLDNDLNFLVLLFIPVFMSYIRSNLDKTFLLLIFVIASYLQLESFFPVGNNDAPYNDCWDGKW